MFGLMLKNSCGLHEAEREQYRMHYCGTCKAVGANYSQSARLLLNSDCVFLAELLSALSREDTENWQGQYQSYLCFNYEGSKAPAPFPLKYAAAANVLLLALKTDDNLKDSPSWYWRLAKSWFDTDFKKAEKELTNLGLDMAEIWRWIACQQSRERDMKITPGAMRALPYYAEPTARITAAIFAQGAAVIGMKREPMYQFGFQLGELIYVLDALEDVEQDKLNGNFNALQKAFPVLNAKARQSTAGSLLHKTQEMQETILSLPLPDALREEYCQRLKTNVTRRVTNALSGKKVTGENAKREFLTRLVLRVQNARSFAAHLVQKKPAWKAVPQYAFSCMAMLLAPRLQQELNAAPSTDGYAVPAFATVMVGFFSVIFFRRRINRIVEKVKKEIKRIRKNWKDESDWKKALWIMLILLGVFITIICLIICCNCNNECNKCDCDCNECTDECCADTVDRPCE